MEKRLLSTFLDLKSWGWVQIKIILQPASRGVRPVVASHVKVQERTDAVQGRTGASQTES